MLLLLVLLGCNDGSSGPGTGSLAIAVSGLPQGIPAAITVTGPDGFSRPVVGNQTLAALVPGDYSLAAAQVSLGNSAYAPTPDVQTITVTAGETPATATVAYALAIGSLVVTVTGLPDGTPAAVQVTGPGFSRTLTGSTTLNGLVPGAYSVDAASVSTGATTYHASPATQTLDVGGPTSAPVSYNISATDGLDLSIDGMYVIQSTQTYDGTVPLVRQRDGLLRVFVHANQVNAAQPAVRVRLYQNHSVVWATTIVASSPAVPTTVAEGNLQQSWNLVIPATLMQPGLAVRADVDPDGVIDEGDEGDNAFPASGTPLELAVRTVPMLRVRFVPVRQSVNGRLGNITSENRHQFLSAALKMHPVLDYEADVRAVYTTSVPALDPDNANSAWNQVLSEVNGLRVSDPDASGYYYYGVLNTAYASGIAGVGYVPGRTAVGWDNLPSAANVAAHELGHNWGRFHAPCGDVTQPDLNYPYSGGIIGAYGFDFSTGTLKSPSSSDVMGYCPLQWISDYTYVNVMNFRDANSFVASRAREPGLLVWGRIVQGEPVLEPAFEVLAPSSLPERPGPYALEGRASDGSLIFSLSFAPEEVADAGPEDSHFAFVVPLARARSAHLASLRLSGRGRIATATAPAPGGPRFRVGAAPGEAAVRRVGADRIGLHWDAAAHPVVMVRDPVTEQILSFARGGDAQIWTQRDEVELVVSDRIRTQVVRAKVTPQ